MATKNLTEIVPGDVVRVEWAPKTLTRPAKTVAVTVSECSLDYRDAVGGDAWVIKGEFTPEWGDYPTTNDSKSFCGNGENIELEIIERPEDVTREIFGDLLDLEF